MPCISGRLTGALFALTILVSACAIGPKVGAPTGAELETVERGEKAIVLLRHSVTRDGKPFASADSRLFTYANIDKGELPPVFVTLNAPSEEALDQGWLYMTLRPGNYYFLPYPPGMQQNPPAVAYHVDSGQYGRLANHKLKLRRDVFWYAAMQRYLIKGARPDDFDPVRGFILQVPAGGKVFYVGSISIACGSIPGIFGRLTDACSPFKLADESAQARMLSARTFGSARPFVTAMMTPYGEPSAALTRQILTSFKLDIETEPEPLSDVTGALAKPIFLLPGSGVGTIGSARAFGVFNVLSLLVQAGMTASEKKEAQARKEKLAPCFKRLQEGIKPAEIAAELRHALDVALRKRGSSGLGPKSANQSSPVTAMKVTWNGSGLRECVEKGRFCVEIALRVRFGETTGGISPYDSILVYSNWYRSDPLKSSSRLYEVVLPQRSMCRPIENYCGENGLALVRREIGQGISHIASHIAENLMGSQ